MTTTRRHPGGGATLTFELGQRGTEILDRLMAEMGLTWDQVLSRGLVLLDAAHAAVAEGKAVGVAANPETLETEFTGI